MTAATVSVDQLQRVGINFVLAVAFFVLLFLATRATWGAIVGWLRVKFGGGGGGGRAAVRDYDADERDGYGDVGSDGDEQDESPPPQRRRTGGVRKRIE